MQTLNARDALREKRIYYSIKGKEIDVTLTPYVIEVMWEQFLRDNAEIIRIKAELPDLLEKVTAENAEEMGKKADAWKALADKLRGDKWKMVGIILEMNENPYTLEEAQGFLATQEIPVMIQFALGVDDASKKNAATRDSSS